MKRFLLIALSLLLATFANAQLSGTYTINSNASQNPNYTSFSAAVSALSAGVSGQVVFEVAPGTYEEYVNLGSISGASESNRVIFRGMGSTNLDVTLTSNAGYTDNSTVKLTSTGYVTFENMTLATTSANKAKVVTLTNGTTSIHFSEVRFVGRVSTGNNDGDANIVYMASGDWADANNVFSGCEFVNGFIALYYQGHNIYQYNDGLLVENCTFTNQSSKSIYITFTDHVTVRGNVINSDYDEKSDYNAIDVYRCRYGCLFENNVMNVTRTSNYTNVFRMRPVVGSETEPVIIRNNIINLQCSANSSYCCDFDYDDSNYIYFANNTIKCTGTGTVGSIFVEDDWSNLYMYNNLIVNETPGYVFRFQNNSTDRFCDYNRIAFSGSNFARMGSNDYPTMTDWTAATGFDTHSALCTPQFVGGNDLHITDATGLTVANPLSYVPIDIDGDTRSNTPCAGADEYATGANLPPVVANPIANIVFETYPASQTINLTNTFNDPDDPNENIVITIASNSNPSLVGTTLNNRTLQVQRLQNTGGSALITLNAESAGQSVQTSFTVECVAEDLPPVVVNPLAPISFTDYPQTLSFDLSNTFDDPDNNNEFIEITVHTCPSQISAFINDDDLLTVSRTTPDAFSNQALVIRATSNGKHVDMNVSVSGVEVVITINAADFEDVALGPNGYWQGEEGENEMFSGGWLFTNYYSSYFWGGFTASNHTDLTQTGLDAQYTAAAGIGYDGSAQYAVAYTYGSQTDVYAADGSTQTVTGCYVTNNLWAYQSILNGDAMTTPFGGPSGNDPDWFKLTATGKNANGQAVGTVEFYLADYRFSNNNEDYVLNTWEWFDLSTLGEVATISFSLSSSKNDSYGMLTPAYFCMDDFNGVGPNAPDLPPYIANPVPDVIMTDFPQTVEVNLDGVATDPDDPDEDIVYSLVSNANPTAVSASVSGKMLSVTRLVEEASEATLVLRATSDGQTVDFNVHVVLNEYVGVEEHLMSIEVYPNPCEGMLHLGMGNAEVFEYSIYDLTGQIVTNGHSQGQETLVDMSRFPAGVYFITVIQDGNCFYNKLILN